MELRSYQSAAIDRLREAYVGGAGGAILELATGAGKTATAMAIAAGVLHSGGSVLWLAHRRELVEQARQCAEAVGLGEAMAACRLVLCTVQGRGWVGVPESPTVVVVDEGHRALAASYRAVFAAHPAAFRLLLTGTAWRSDGGDFSSVAEVTVQGPSIGELTEAGWLVPAVYWSVPGADVGALRVRRGEFVAAEVSAAVDRPQLVGDVAATFARHAGGRRGVVFCAGVLHAAHVAEALRGHGIAAADVHGGTPKTERARLLAAHQTGDLQVLCNADLLIEGWDNPAVSAVSLARPTASAIVWRQAVGRGLRPAHGKTDCVVLDHGGNCLRLGLVADPLAYEAGGCSSARARSDGPSLVTCSACFAVFASQPRPVTCPRCFEVLPVKALAVQAVAGELVQFDGAAVNRPRVVDWTLWNRLDRERQRKGYRAGWTWARYAASAEVKGWSNG